MTLFSILLIENQVAVAAVVVQTIGQHLLEYRLTITQAVAHAVAEPEPAQVILLNIAQLNDDVCPMLSALNEVYPGVPIVLLHDASIPPAEVEEQKLLEALAWGVATYAPLSKVGLTALAKQLAAQQSAWQAQQKQNQPDLTSGNLLYQAISSDTSHLAIQIIGPDHRLRAWNRAAETLFGLNKPMPSAPLIESLPLSPDNLGRLKDFLDQARSSGEPLFIPNFSLENPQSETHWVQLHLYPIYAEASQLADICVISADVTDLKRTEIQQGQYSQELQILLETSRQISGRLELVPTLEKIVEQTKMLLNADNGRIYFLEKDQDTLQPILSIGPLPDQEYPTAIPLGHSPIGTVAASGRAAMLSTASQPHEHLLCVPLTASKEMMGVMVISRTSKTPFVADDLRFLESIVRQVSASIYNARRFEETRNNLNELTLLYETSSAIATARDTEAVLSTLIRQMAQALNVSMGHIVSWDKYRTIGTIQAEFLNDAATPSNSSETGRTFNLAQRPALLPIQQQQALVFQVNDPDLDEAERREMVKRGSVSRLLVPLVVKDEAIGWAELWETRLERIFTADEIRLARMLANQAAVALENLQYLTQTQQALEETDALYHVASALASTQDAQTIMSTVLQEYLRALDLRQGSVIFFDFETKSGVVKVNFQDDLPWPPAALVEEALVEGRPAQGLEGWRLPLRNNPLYERLMATHRPVVIDDTLGRLLPFLPKAVPPLPALIRLGWAGPETLSLLVLPIQIRGEIIGALVVEATRQKHTFNPGEIALGQAMADQLGIGLQNVELYEAEYRRRQQAETLREVSFVVGSSLNLNEVLERILDQLARVIKYDSATIHLIEGKRRRIIAGRGFPNPKKVIGLTFPVKLDTDQEDPGALVIQKRQPLVVGNVPASYNVLKKSPQEHIKSWMGIPLIARDKVIGLISIDHTEANAYNEDDLRLALAFANQVSIALENARLYEIEVRELERELEIAQGIQETLLPQFAPKVPGLQISGRILPARQIGGDFFHFFPIGNDRFGVAIGDVSGKGIPAALYMAVAITAIDAQIRVDLGPGELLNRLNYILYNRLRENKMNIGLQVATFAPIPASQDGKPGTVMTLASAGMIAPIGASKHSYRLLPVSGFPVGALSPPEQNYHDDVFVLDPHTTIIFTSDGIVEAQNEARELFGFERLEATINEVIDTQDAETIAEHIINTAQTFVGQAEQNDDMTVVVVVKT